MRSICLRLNIWSVNGISLIILSIMRVYETAHGKRFNADINKEQKWRKDYFSL